MKTLAPEPRPWEELAERGAQPESLAFEKLCGDSWAARLPRSLTTDRSIPFGAVVVYAAACAWRDRGPGWGFTDDDEVFTRTSAAIPPGGWPALVGVSPHTWRKWRDAAVVAGLVEIEVARKSPRPLLRPVAKLEDGEQFARVEVGVLFHRNLSKRARRVCVAASLFRQSSGTVAVCIEKIGDDAGGLSRRHVQDAMRELVSAGVLQPDGKTAKGINRYLVKTGTPLVNHLVILGTPPMVKTGTPAGKNGDPSLVKTGTHSGTLFRNSFQEPVSGGAESGNPPRAPAPVFIKTPREKKDAPVATPESRKANTKIMANRIAALPPALRKSVTSAYQLSTARMRETQEVA